MKLKTLNDVRIRNKRILLRIDINAPVVKGKIQDSPRFAASSETIRELLKKNAKIIILAHQGRKGDKDFLSLEQHAEILSWYVKKKILYVDDLFGKKAHDKIMKLGEGQAILLKNVRAYNDEMNFNKNNRYRDLCKHFDIYVNDAFSVSHREQGSIILPPRYLPSCVGRDMEKELRALEHFHLKKKGKIIFILGGAKVEDYLPLFRMLKRNEVLIAAGILGNLFLILRGYDLGYEKRWLKKKGYLDLLPRLKRIYQKYREKILLPMDVVLQNGLQKDLGQAPFPSKIMDVGKKSIAFFQEQLQDADLVFMKGPLGFSEYPEYSEGTVALLKKIAFLTQEKKIFSLIGGGHLTTAIAKYKIPCTFSYMSLSGGALIHYISGKKLPGIVALERGMKDR